MDKEMETLNGSIIRHMGKYLSTHDMKSLSSINRKMNNMVENTIRDRVIDMFRDTFPFAKKIEVLDRSIYMLLYDEKVAVHVRIHKIKDVDLTIRWLEMYLRGKTQYTALRFALDHILRLSLPFHEIHIKRVVSIPLRNEIRFNITETLYYRSVSYSTTKITTWYNPSEKYDGYYEIHSQIPHFIFPNYHPLLN